MSATTLSQILQSHLDDYLSNHRLPLYQHKALRSYQRCRTAKMGGHTQVCENGHVMGVWYNSCKRRGCSQCLGLPSERWLDQQRELLLDTTHHHWVFTLPHELLTLWRYNRVLFQDIMFDSVAATLKQLSADTKYLGAKPAFSLTLHTWGRNLILHPHIHCLIAHGGLNEKGDWCEPKKRILFPAKVMMQLFRGKVRAALRRASNIVIPPDMTQGRVYSLLNKLGRKDWIVHCCKPYKHGRGVTSYLSRYVKSGALKSKRLSRLSNSRVKLSYTSHRTKGYAEDRLTIDTLISRVCEHIPAHKKPSVRYYGQYHPCKRVDLNRCREQLGQAPVKEVVPIEPLAYLAQFEPIKRCVQCAAPLKGLGAYLKRK